MFFFLKKLTEGKDYALLDRGRPSVFTEGS